MSDNWLKKWYRDRFRYSFPGSPDEKNWAKIRQRLEEEWPSYWYEANMAKAEAIPRAGLWEELNRNLEVLRVAQRGRRIGLLRSIGLAGMVVVLPFALSDLNDIGTPDIGETENAAASRQSVPALVADNGSSAPSEVVYTNPGTPVQTSPQPTAVLANHSDLHDQQSPLTPENISGIATITPVVNANVTGNSFPETRERISEPIAGTGNTVQEEPRPALAEVNELEIADVQPLALSYDPQPVLTQLTIPGASRPHSGKGLWSISVAPRLQFSTLQNPTTTLGLDPKSRITNKLSCNTAFYVDASWQWSRRSELSLGLLFNDVKCQQYFDFQGSQYIKKEVCLNYQSISLMYRRAFISPAAGRFRMDASIGFYAGLLSDVHEEWDGEETSWLSPGFRKTDFGITAGLNATYRLNRHLGLTTGAYYRNGFVNIFEGVDLLPRDFYKTYTVSFGAQLGLRWYF